MRGALALVAIGAGCMPERLEPCAGASIAPGSHHECAMPDWVDRAYDLDIPDGWDGRAALPIVLVLHGGGGSRQTANRITCPDGDLDSASCLRAVAARRGYAMVTPDGTGHRPLRNVRTWNGGGGDALQCTSGPACKSNVDDVGYVYELLAELRRTIPVDDRRIYATGISNGAAMAHRLACELPDQIAAIVGVAGANQHADDGGACAGRVPVRQIHGTGDPCWRYDGGSQACLQDDGEPKTSVAVTMEGWRTRNGCNGQFVEMPRAERDASDGTRLVIRAYNGCTAATELFTVEGGGHTWPSGESYSDRVGSVSNEVDNADLLDFFDAHVHP